MMALIPEEKAAYFSFPHNKKGSAAEAAKQKRNFLFGERKKVCSARPFLRIDTKGWRANLISIWQMLIIKQN